MKKEFILKDVIISEGENNSEDKKTAKLKQTLTIRFFLAFFKLAHLRT